MRPGNASEDGLPSESGWIVEAVDPAAAVDFLQYPYVVNGSSVDTTGLHNMEYAVDTHPSDLVVAYDAAARRFVYADSIHPLPYAHRQSLYAKSAQMRSMPALAASTTEHYGYSTCHWLRACDPATETVGSPCHATLAGVLYSGFCFESATKTLECGHTMALDDRRGARPIAIGVAISPNVMPSQTGIVNATPGVTTSVLPYATYRCERGSPAISSGAYVAKRLLQAGCMLSSDPAYNMLAEVHVPEYCSAERNGGANATGVRGGCMFSAAINYDPMARQSADCHYHNIGCTDSAALNFHSEATIADLASCIYGTEGCTVHSMRHGGSGEPSVLNFNRSATVNRGCVLAIEGCMNSSAVNYDPVATVNTRTWCIAAALGCMRPDFRQPSPHRRDGSSHYDPRATRHDPALCRVTRVGCRQSTMFNYDPHANIDGPCYPVRGGCLDPSAINFNCTLRQNAPCSPDPSLVVTVHNRYLCHYGLEPPSAPRGDTDTAFHAVTVVIIAAGDPTDYDYAGRAMIATRMATRARVNPSAVAVTIEPASVRITVVITFATANQASAGGALISSSMGDAAAASAFLSITVESAPHVEVGLVFISSPPIISESKSQCDLACIVQSAIGGCILGAFALACCSICILIRRRQRVKIVSL